jgi:hypothetical protein
MSNEPYRTKASIVGDSVPTNRLGQELERRSIPTQALASALAKVPVAPAIPTSQASLTPSSSSSDKK